MFILLPTLSINLGPYSYLRQSNSSINPIRFLIFLLRETFHLFMDATTSGSVCLNSSSNYLHCVAQILSLAYCVSSIEDFQLLYH